LVGYKSVTEGFGSCVIKYSMKVVKLKPRIFKTNNIATIQYKAYMQVLNRTLLNRTDSAINYKLAVDLL